MTASYSWAMSSSTLLSAILSLSTSTCSRFNTVYLSSTSTLSATSCSLTDWYDDDDDDDGADAAADGDDGIVDGDGDDGDDGDDSDALLLLYYYV